MTTSPHPVSVFARGTLRRATRGFTLVEVMIAAGLGAFILSAVLTAFLFMGRSGAVLTNYTDMEAQARRSLEQFAIDVRTARDIVWNDTNRSSGGYSVTLTLPGVASNDPDIIVTYYYDSATTGGTAGCFCRKLGDKDATTTPFKLVSGVVRFGLERYKAGTLGVAANDLETKQLQLTLTASRQGSTLATTTNIVLSARYILRNKPYSQVAVAG